MENNIDKTALLIVDAERFVRRERAWKCPTARHHSTNQS